MITLTPRQLGVIGAGSVTVTQSGLNYVISGSATSSTGSATSNDRALVHTISLANHGFPVESIVTIDSAGNYVKALANSASKTYALGIVNASGATSFSFVSAGYIDTLIGKTPNTPYYLSPSTSGLLTEVPTTTTGSFIAPILVTDSATGGYVNIGTPIEIVADDYLTTGLGFATYYPRTNPSGYLATLSGLSTGLIQNMSGDLSARLGATGSTLLGLINASSAGVGSLNGASGALNLTGAGSVSVIVNGQVLTISGSATTADFSGYITTGNADLRYYPLGLNPSGFLNTLSGLSTGYIQNISGVLADKIGATGQTLLALINASSAGVSSVNAQSGALNLTGAGNTTVIVEGQTITISGSSAASSSSRTFDRVYPFDSAPSGSNFATIDTRNSIPVLDFDPSGTEHTIFNRVLPEGINLSNGADFYLKWSVTQGVTGVVNWRVDLMNVFDLNTGSWLYGANGTGLVHPNSGISTTVIRVNPLPLSENDFYRLRVQRILNDGISGTAVADAELSCVEMRTV